MKPVYDNAFRQLGLEANASLKDIKRNVSRLTQYANVSQTKKMAYDLSFLGYIERTAVSIEEAYKKVNGVNTKLLESFFWFIAHSDADKEALKLLKEDRYEQAYLALKNEVDRKVLSVETVSSYLNYSTLLLLSDNADLYHEGIRIKIQIAGYSQIIRGILSLIGYDKKTVEKEDLVNKVASKIIKGLEEEYPGEKKASLLNFFSKCDESFKKKFVGYLTADIASRLIKLCSDFQNENDTSFSKLISFEKDAKPLVLQLQNYENYDNGVNRIYFDNFSGTLLQGLINFFNDLSGDITESRERELLRMSDLTVSFAKSKLKVDRAVDSRNSLIDIFAERKKQPREFLDMLYRIKAELLRILPTHSIRVNVLNETLVSAINHASFLKNIKSQAIIDDIVDAFESIDRLLSNDKLLKPARSLFLGSLPSWYTEKSKKKLEYLRMESTSWKNKPTSNVKKTVKHTEESGVISFSGCLWIFGLIGAIIFLINIEWDGVKSNLPQAAIPKVSIPKISKLIDPDAGLTEYLFPISGEIVWFTPRQFGNGELTIHANDSDHYYIKVYKKNRQQKTDIFAVYLRAGESTTLLMTGGTYGIKYASGKKWYGNEELFGANTVFSEPTEYFDIIDTRRQYSIVSLTLYKVSNGNLSTRNIDRNDF